jgi:hypothetical protein
MTTLRQPITRIPRQLPLLPSDAVGMTPKLFMYYIAGILGQYARKFEGSPDTLLDHNTFALATSLTLTELHLAILQAVDAVADQFDSTPMWEILRSRNIPDHFYIEFYNIDTKEPNHV